MSLATKYRPKTLDDVVEQSMVVSILKNMLACDNVPFRSLLFIETLGVESTTTITSDDSPAMAKIKRFMALYGIVDIKMRMLRIPELKRIMGFPPDYVLVGTQADQKKFIGNAVEVNMARVLCEALCARLIEGDWRPIQIAA